MCENTSTVFQWFQVLSYVFLLLCVVCLQIWYFIPMWYRWYPAFSFTWYAWHYPNLFQLDSFEYELVVTWSLTIFHVLFVTWSLTICFVRNFTILLLNICLGGICWDARYWCFFNQVHCIFLSNKKAHNGQYFCCLDTYKHSSKRTLHQVMIYLVYKSVNWINVVVVILVLLGNNNK